METVSEALKWIYNEKDKLNERIKFWLTIYKKIQKRSFIHNQQFH